MENTNTTKTSEPLQTDTYFNTQTFAALMEAGSKEPPRRKIAGCFLYEATDTFFYSRANMGKSIFAFMIAYAAATGTSIDPCSALCNECEPMKTMVLDLEMDSKILFDRHGAVIAHANPELLANLIYLHEKPSKNVLMGFELLDKIEQAAIENQAKLIIIDNLSKLIPDTLKAETVAKVISCLKRIREKTGASFLVIGHCTKGDPKLAVSSSSYYGSAAFQNFFFEMFYLDATKDGRFFLCNAKSKKTEQYKEFVPVLTRGDHPVYGLGFTFERICALDEVQLPTMLLPERSSRKVNLADFQKEIIILDQAGIKRNRIAEMFGVVKSSITRVLEPVPF